MVGYLLLHQSPDDCPIQSWVTHIHRKEEGSAHSAQIEWLFRQMDILFEFGCSFSSPADNLSWWLLPDPFSMAMAYFPWHRCGAGIQFPVSITSKRSRRGWKVLCSNPEYLVYLGLRVPPVDCDGYETSIGMVTRWMGNWIVSRPNRFISHYFLSGQQWEYDGWKRCDLNTFGRLISVYGIEIEVRID